ncbi:hypothetical protein C2E21_6863 [Chlorella sorokiniana]|uniref:Uncharacterized protein n=1 Tax=Chlorella sorokiniana TaxID=3076 RepID=A0A2P6TJU7_CHLSO|nr:hypothetical protein C2E21_6863 [Chlorella sorokiniana]|eukprot:PRW44362.1 hypothetical protein C2E21_6863 [Chlorella sorokiniana]
MNFSLLGGLGAGLRQTGRKRKGYQHAELQEEAPKPVGEAAVFAQDALKSASLQELLARLRDAESQVKGAAADHSNTPSPLKQPLTNVLDEVQQLLKLPAADLMVSPMLADCAHCAADQAAKLARPLADGKGRQLKPEQVAPTVHKLERLASYLSSHRSAFLLLPYKSVGVSFTVLHSHVTSRFKDDCIKVLQDAGLKNNGLNNFTLEDFPQTEPAGEPKPAFIIYHEQRVDCYIRFLDLRFDTIEVPEVLELRSLLDAALSHSKCYGEKLSKALSGQGWRRPFVICFSSLPRDAMRDLDLKFLPAAGLDMKAVHELPPKGTVCGKTFNLSTPLLLDHAACPEFVHRHFREQAKVVKYVMSLDTRWLDKDKRAQLLANMSSLRERLQAAEHLAGTVGMAEALAAEQTQLEGAADAAIQRNLTLELHQATSSGLTLLSQQLSGLGVAFAAVLERLTAAEARLPQAPAEAAAAGSQQQGEAATADGTELWEMFSPMRQVAPAESGAAESPKASAGTAVAQSSADAEAHSSQQAAGSREAAAASDEAVVAASGEPAAAASDEAGAVAVAAVPAGFVTYCNALYGCAGTGTPAAPHGRKLLGDVAAGKEQRAAN